MVELRYISQLTEIFADGVKFNKGEVKYVSDAAALAILKDFPDDFMDNSIAIISEPIAEEVIIEVEKPKLDNKEPKHGIFK